MKRALITGITGQDGSCLAELLRHQDDEVDGIVRRASTTSTSARAMRAPACCCTTASCPTVPERLDRKATVDGRAPARLMVDPDIASDAACRHCIHDVAPAGGKGHLG